jgi:hypothetical protein
MYRPCELEKTARSQSNRPTGDTEWHPRRGAIGPLDGEAEDPAAWTLDDDVAPTMQVIALGAQHGELGPEQRMDGHRDGYPVKLLFLTCRSLRQASRRPGFHSSACRGCSGRARRCARR